MGLGLRVWQTFHLPAKLETPGGAGRPWEVVAVVVDGDQVGVYCIEVSALLASELQAAWATWGEGEAVAAVDGDKGDGPLKSPRAWRRG